jgi:hypothetical protein
MRGEVIAEKTMVTLVDELYAMHDKQGTANV